MRTMIRAILRMFDRALLILAAYLAASVVATLSLALVFTVREGPTYSLLFLAMFYGTSLVTMYAAVPTAVVIAIAEGRRYRSARFYAAAGSMTGILSIAVFYSWPLMSSRPSIGAAASPTQYLEFAGWLAACAVTGMLAGLVYWRVAGREAGAWRA